MEREFWDALLDIAADRNTTISALIKEIGAKAEGNVSGRGMASALRVFILEEMMPVKPPTIPRLHRKKRPVARSY
jgi:predicted DNA-binding ribbon-helix-helix protein